jgi:tRNA A-37 threonylcarbamoyl transferase component Bud32
MTDSTRSHLPLPAPDQPPTGAYQPEEGAATLVRVLDEYLADLQAGRAPDRAQLLAAHPALASQLEQCLAGIEFIHHAAQPAPGTPAQLGDFRIVREIGRGGMGVVYEAEQLSLKRKVALKVLRFGAIADLEVVQRFQHEAETVARLHHTNIVPIFAVGSEQGVHYYVMQFIEGQSLAAVIKEARGASDEGRGKQGSGTSSLAPHPSFSDIARWGLQAAEALAHAHQRGVIHRDIKPSNLLLDPEGIIWLTDFGLAKRMDEVTLTGLIVGTPRYMSPEQAAVVKQPVDHRTDIYSLGATLYELATGQPVFDADTPQGILSQIQNTEPLAPRRVRPTLPRDLETIILKCVAKEPGQRYSTARELAADLRAFLEGGAIKARRPSLAERAIRWARKRRRSALPTAITAVASVVAVVGSLVAWHGYAEWRQGRFLLTTDGPALEAEILDANDEAVIPPFTVPTRQPLSLPGGLYRVRVSAPGQLSETYQMLVEQGLQSRYDVRLGERRLCEPLDVSLGFDVLEMDGRSDILVTTENGLRRVHGATGKEVWTGNVNQAGPAGAIPIKNSEWRYFRTGLSIWDDLNPEDNRRARLVYSAREREGDGAAYLVCASPIRPWLLALSDKDGAMKWWYQSQSPTRGQGGIREPGTGKRLSDPPAGRVVCAPLFADVDGDGVPDVIAVFGSLREDLHHSGENLEEEPRWVEAVSGRTGRLLWRYIFNLRKAVATTPPATTHSRIVRSAAALTQEEGKRVLAVATSEVEASEAKADREGSGKLVVLDLQTGMPIRPPTNFGFESVNTPMFVDLNGDGRLGVLLVRSKSWSDLTLTAIGLSGSPLWEHQVEQMAYGGSRAMPPMTWPVVTDLDGDGKPAILVPYGNGREQGQGGWVGVETLDAATGQSRWAPASVPGLWRVRGGQWHCASAGQSKP